MRGLRGWAMRLESLFRERRLDQRLDDGLRFHLDMQARDNPPGAPRRHWSFRPAVPALCGKE